MKFQKKPVVIDAVQFTGTNHEEICAFVGKENMVVASELPHITIVTLEGNMKASQGDWIIRGVKGEYYPCKPDIFEQTYQPVEEEPVGCCDGCEQGYGCEYEAEYYGGCGDGGCGCGD